MNKTWLLGFVTGLLIGWPLYTVGTALVLSIFTARREEDRINARTQDRR